MKKGIERIIKETKFLIKELYEKEIAQIEKEIAQIENLLEHYSSILDKFQSLPSEQTVALLKTRDDVQDALNNKKLFTLRKLTTLVDLDNRLKKYSSKIIYSIDLANYRVSMNPPSESWWWYFDHRMSRIWIFCSGIWLLAVIIILIDIIPRFTSVNPDYWAAAVIIVPSIATLMAAKATLFPTKRGQDIKVSLFERILNKTPLSYYQWPKVKCFLSILFFALAVIFYHILPVISDYYRFEGKQYLEQKYPTEAISNFKRALSIDPDDARTHYYFARHYEELQEVKLAKLEYQKAAITCKPNIVECAASYNNLARLYILDEEYYKAWYMLRRHFRPIAGRDLKLNYYLHKNMGWVLYKLNFLNDAEAKLRAAIVFANDAELPKKDKIIAHCLLAQVLNKREKPRNDVCEHWIECKNIVYIYPEEFIWYHMAKERKECTH